VILEEKIKKVLSKVEDSYMPIFTIGVYRGLTLAWARCCSTGWYPGDRDAIDNFRMLHEAIEKKYNAMSEVLDPWTWDLIAPFMKGILKGLEYARKIAENKEVEEK